MIFSERGEHGRKNPRGLSRAVGSSALRQEFHCGICVSRKNVAFAALAVNGLMTHLHGTIAGPARSGPFLPKKRMRALTLTSPLDYGKDDAAIANNLLCRFYLSGTACCSSKHDRNLSRFTGTRACAPRGAALRYCTGQDMDCPSSLAARKANMGRAEIPAP